MTNSPPANQPQEQSTPPPTPGWVKIILVVVLALVLLAAIGLLTGVGGEHGPGQHNPASLLPTERALLIGLRPPGISLL